VVVCVKGKKGTVFPEGVTVRTWSAPVEQPLPDGPMPDGPIPDGGEVPDGGEIGAPQRYILWEQSVGFEMWRTDNTVCTESLMFGQIEGVYEGALTLCFPAVVDGLVEFCIGPEPLLYQIVPPCLRLSKVEKSAKAAPKPADWSDVTGNTYDQPQYKHRNSWQSVPAYKAYLSLRKWRVRGRLRVRALAEWLRIRVKVEGKAGVVRWVFLDEDDPAGHPDVDPTDYKVERGKTVKDCVAPYGFGNPDDNTGNNMRIQEATVGGVRYRFVGRPRRIRFWRMSKPRDICPRFPVEEVGGNSYEVFTEVKDGESAVVFRPTNDGGDNYWVYAFPYDKKDGRSLCCGQMIRVVVWRKVKVAVYAMRKRQGAGYYFPGKDFDSLKTALKRAFGDVTNGDVTDPDRNCYIEVEVKKDRGVAGQWLTEYEDKVENLHNYALNKTNYHLDRRGKHPIYSAQLTGIRDWIDRREEDFGITVPLPHCWVADRAFKNRKLRISTPYADVYPYLQEDMRFVLKVKMNAVTKSFSISLRSVDGKPGISPMDLAALLNQPRDKPYTVRILQKWVTIWEAGEAQPKRVKWNYVVVETEGKLGFFSSDPKITPALQMLGVPVGRMVDTSDWRNLVSIHEIGHCFYNGGRIRRSTSGDMRLEIWYHFLHCSYRESSVSSDGRRYPGVCGWYFSPLIAREMRCSVFANFGLVDTGYGD